MSKPPAFSSLLLTAYLLDRAVKVAAVAHFFSRPAPAPPEPCPSVTLVQPVTRGAGALSKALEARARLDYPGPLQHVLVCDAASPEMVGACREWAAAHPNLRVEVAEVEWPGGIAPKTVKIQAGLERAESEIVCMVDDDIILRPDALQVLVRHLCAPSENAGAAFGLACYTAWGNLPSSLMSAFVNANALFTYVPGTYLTDPFTITGHIFAMRRDFFLETGGFKGLEDNVGDDHEMARRVRRASLRCVQTPLVYDVENPLPTLRAYAAQMHRWFVFPRQAMLPYMTPREQAATALTSLGNFMPPALALVAATTRSRRAWRALLGALGAYAATYALAERLYLRRKTPLHSWPVALLMELLSPVQIVGALLSSNRVQWRGKWIVVERGGTFREAPSA